MRTVQLARRFVREDWGGTETVIFETSRRLLSMGHHAEVYSDLVELIDRPPRSGVIIASDDVLERGISTLLDDLADAGIWTPLVAAKPHPEVEEVVKAIQAGALAELYIDRNELSAEGKATIKAACTAKKVVLQI